MIQKFAWLILILVGLGLAGALPAAAQKRGGTVNWLLYGDPGRLDLHQASPLSVAQATGGIFSGLVQWDPGAPENIVPDLATSYDIKAGGSVFVFHLRKGVKWHDGKPFTSADVKATFDRLMDPNFRSRRCGAMIRPVVKSVEAVDKYTVRITLKFPTGIFISQMASAWCRIVAKHILERDGDLNHAKSQIGTGPFKFMTYKRNQIIEWKRNPDYYDSRYPYVDGVKIYIIKGKARQLAAAKAGKLDTMIYPRFNPSQIKELKNALGSKVKTYARAVNGFWTVMFNSQKEPFNKKDMRRAVFLGLDRQNLIDKGFEGYGTPCTILNPKIFGEFALTLKEVNATPGCRQPKGKDRAEARRLVKKHYPNGIDIEIVTRQVGNYPDRIQLVAAELHKIGINAKIRTYRSAPGYKVYAQGDFTIIGTQDHGFVLGDPHDVFAFIFAKDGGRNWGNWDNAKVEAMITQGLQETDKGKRIKIYHELQRYLYSEDSPVVVIGANEGFYWENTRLKNFHQAGTVYDALTFMKVWLEE